MKLLTYNKNDNANNIIELRKTINNKDKKIYNTKDKLKKMAKE